MKEKYVVLQIAEVEAFTMDMAVANVGGQSGLWLGASFVTLIQAIYYLVLGFVKKVGKSRSNTTAKGRMVSDIIPPRLY